MEFFNIDFWRDFLSNGAATLLGAIIGIPIALWLSKFQQNKEELKRKNKILRLLKEELLVNIGPLSRWKKSANNLTTECMNLIVFIKIQHWSAFSDGGELQWIKNPDLLGKIADAYNYLRMIKDLCNKYVGIIPFPQYGKSNEAIPEIIQSIDKGIEETIHEIKTAIDAISIAEEKLQNK